MPRPISDEERAEIAKLYDEGWAKKRIARKIGRASSTVADVLGAEDRGARRQRESERKIKPPPKQPIGPLPVADTGWFAPLTRDQLRAGKMSNDPGGNPAPKVWRCWTLPVPTSTNKLYNDRKVAGKGRRPKTPDYRAWIEAAGKTIMAQGPRPQIKGEYLMDVSLPPGLDLDNGLKALGDLLQSMGIVENDKLCWDLHVRRDRAEPECILRVRAR